MRSAGQLTERTGVGGTVKVALQEAVCPQASVASKLMVTSPPQKGGALRVVRSVLVVRQPPSNSKLASQVTKALSTWACVRQLLTVVSAGHVTESGSGGSTEKVAVQLAVDPQASVAMKVMVVAPPQESGGEKVVRSVVSTSQPPEKEN